MSCIRKSGFTEPTPIQAIGFPIGLKGMNMVGVSRTGSGKTLAFLLPSVVHIRAQECLKTILLVNFLAKIKINKFSTLKKEELRRGDGPVALVLLPTRELAQQVEQVSRDFVESSGIYTTCVFGGAPKGPQLRDLERGCEIVIATPGMFKLFNFSVTNILNQKYIILEQVIILSRVKIP